MLHTQLYVTYNPNVLGDMQRAMKQLEYCIAEIRGWMINRMLKLNDITIYAARNVVQALITSRLD